MSEKSAVITIDGPSGVGKSTVSRKVAAVTGYLYLDTGAMYRGVGLYLARAGVDLADDRALASALADLDLHLTPAPDEDRDVGVFLGGEDVSAAVRTPEMAMIASRVSALAPVRKMLTKKQREYGRLGRIIAEGRDTGTVVFPEAACKFFLDAEPEERAARRVAQLHSQGLEADFTQILAMTVERDSNDRQRALAPLRPAADAHCIDTTRMTVEEVVDTILETVRGAGFQNCEPR